MFDDNEPRPIDYLAHQTGYVNRHGEALEFDERYVEWDEDDAYPYGDNDAEVCG